MTAPDVKRTVRNWALPVVLALMAVGIAISYALLIPVLREQSQQARATAAAARTACLRSQELGPPILRDYMRRHVLTPAELKRYRALIPKTCPGK